MTVADEFALEADADVRAATGAPAPRPGRRRRQAMGALKYVLLTFGALLMVLPFADTFIGALRSPADVFANPPRYFPSDPQWGVYGRVFAELPMGRWIFNSVVVTVTITVVQVATSAMAGWALARYEFPGRANAFRLVVGAQMFPFFLFVIPIFFLLRFAPLAGGNDILGQGGSGLLGTYAALVLPFAVTWYGVFLMRQFFTTIPEELIEAARLDGASEWLIFRRIALPLVRPALATLAVFAFVYHWNEFIWTMTITRTAPELQTLPVGIFLLENQFQDLDQKALQQAALAVSVLPVLVLFALAQRFFVSASMESAVK
ncbi:carbohydrate ABC transporter membrane protein 2 (CUT1 family) [Hasllibacter halocynthiae]|uniref:sn-glycerol-3-phosphate transport system permease protein UgpE n=1 Tax=Hasllibacter halocynthiae TaxID=595589 RepID=A0A2T0X2D4_9RHOB|nr:carbohydrate ABC transporter permease [Hasllibacter halocynthiae]PRY93106.1 carbohydrate ABC transporter membrane protein 2 (CUT1 family) [Hasllibacter halocynthiae]